MSVRFVFSRNTFLASQRKENEKGVQATIGILHSEAHSMIL